MATIATLCFIVKGGKILLIKKKTGFGAGKWNGPGGKVNQNEQIVDAASREVFEEIDIVPDNPRFMGLLEFYNGGSDPEWVVHVFHSEDYDGIEKETQDAAPKWFSISRIPYDEMWPDDKFWLPLLLQKKMFKGTFHFDSKFENMLKHEVEAVE